MLWSTCHPSCSFLLLADSWIQDIQIRLLHALFYASSPYRKQCVSFPLWFEALLLQVSALSLPILFPPLLCLCSVLLRRLLTSQSLPADSVWIATHQAWSAGIGFASKGLITPPLPVSLSLPLVVVCRLAFARASATICLHTSSPISLPWHAPLLLSSAHGLSHQRTWWCPYIVKINGDPIESARLRLKGVTTKVVKNTSSDADGFFEFTGLGADTYVIFAKKMRYKKAKATVKLEEEESKEIEIEMKKTSKRIMMEREK